MRVPPGLRAKPAVTPDEIQPELVRISRRRALARGLSLGGLTLLTGCDLSTHFGVDAALWAMMRFDDRLQAALFSRTRLAQTYPASAVTKPFRFNAYYEEWQVREAPPDSELELSGLVADKSPWTIDKLRALPQEAQVTRHICIEGWSQIGQWSGVPLHVFLQRVGAFSLSARLYVSLPGMEPEMAQRLVDAAHQPCPYSRATHGNIAVETTLV